MKSSIHICFRRHHKYHFHITSIVEQDKVTKNVQLDSWVQDLKICLELVKDMEMIVPIVIIHHKICIVISIVSMDNMFLKIFELGLESFIKYDSYK